jgi:DNA polymerase III alpha subunit
VGQQLIEPIKLEGYKLWADGTIEVEPEDVPDFALKLAAKGISLDHLATSRITKEIEQFNLIGDAKIRLKTELSPVFPPDWILPEAYKYLDLDGYLVGLADRIEHDELYDQRLVRLSEEIYLYLKLELHDLLRTLIYVVDKFKEHGVVWGVGRGSSCSSYLLFLIGLHEVDAVKYCIPLSDFLKPTGD